MKQHTELKPSYYCRDFKKSTEILPIQPSGYTLSTVFSRYRSVSGSIALQFSWERNLNKLFYIFTDLDSESSLCLTNRREGYEVWAITNEFMFQAAVRLPYGFTVYQIVSCVFAMAAMLECNTIHSLFRIESSSLVSILL